MSIKVDPGYSFADTLDGLARLQSLRHFTWQGADFVDSYVFADVIMRNAHHLETLDIGFQHNSQVVSAMDLALRLVCLFLPSGGVPLKRLTALKSLGLRNMSLQVTFSALQPNFDFSQLRSLKLRDCRYVLNFLRGARLHSPEINLKALEIDYNAPASDNVDIPNSTQVGGLVPEFARFLRSFQGLEQIYFRAMEFFHESIQQTPQGIINHAHTLKRLVCHYHDKLSLGPGKDCPIVYADGMGEIFESTRVESLGLNVLPCDLVSFYLRLELPIVKQTDSHKASRSQRHGNRRDR